MPWVLSQGNPAWALRYTAVAVGPLLLLAALGTARAGRLGLAAVAITALVWSAFDAPVTKSNVHSVTEEIAPSLRPGDTVISTQPEQVPVLHYYLHAVLDLRYATLFGPLSDLGVTDWRDGTEHLAADLHPQDLDPVLDAVAARPARRARRAGLRHPGTLEGALVGARARPEPRVGGQDARRPALPGSDGGTAEPRSPAERSPGHACSCGVRLALHFSRAGAGPFP